MDGKTLVIPDDVYQRVDSIARRAGWDTADFIAKRLRDTFPPLQTELDTRPVATLTDSEVVALALSKMPTALNNRMSDLIADQKERSLDRFEVSELESLMDFYHAGQLRKAEAMVEAKERGLDLPGLA
jgi:hypothetical protein